MKIIKNIYHFFYRKIYSIKIFIRTTIPNSFQRMYKGYGFADTWGFDYYLSKIIPRALAELRDRKLGIPSILIEAKDISKITDEESKKAQEKWIEILNKIIKTFETARKIQESDYSYIPSYSKDFSKHYIEACRILTNLDIHIMTLEESKEYEEGWRLFQEWFFYLWD